MNKFIISIDQGTTSSRTVVFDSVTLAPLFQASKEYTQYYPQPGWVEHDLDEIWQTIQDTFLKCLDFISHKTNDILAIGITNQRETTCAYDQFGNPLSKAIVWQDRRTSDFCHQNQEAYEKLRRKTGLKLDPYFSATKMKWLLTNNDNVKKAAKNNNLHLSTIDSFLLFKLTGCHSFCTDSTNASRTLLYNLESNNWDQELLTFFGISSSFLPEIKNTFDHFGTTKNLSFLPDGIPIKCLIGDQQSALLGQGAIDEGDLKCTYGTGAFVLLNTGHNICFSNNGLLTTVAFSHCGKRSFALEGSCYIAGAAVQWLRDNLNLIESSSQIEQMALQVHNLEEMIDVLFFPFFTGIGTPYWISEAKASIIGLNRGTNKFHLARACLEGICLSICDLINTLESESILPIKNMLVDGGATNNNLMLQIQADLLGKKILRPKNIETTSLGAALGSAIGLGLIKLNQVKNYIQNDFESHPSSLHSDYYSHKKEIWKKYITSFYLPS